ncbi:glycosyltransferase [Rhodobacter sp. KR11]|uniref:glycosyltransferase n=1 Tax=Rhodobacter sp. KR11 TaxID=2974588 RepID=UPI0022233194|nr:glycosyltransferase [Rhodobacter sp. KR11]MCW1917740.1 glycosyltransferase [Rhodobacter sp. KR11]
MVLCLILQYLGTGLALWALGRAPGADSGAPVTVLRPICGLENNLAETLESTFSAPGAYEVIFCAADPADPAIALAQEIIARHPEVPARVLVGDDKISGNPKLNNLVKGWKAATHDLILMSDSNVLLPPDYLARLRGQMGPGVGLVSSPPIGIRPEGFAARLECAFLNTHQARWQMAGAALDQGFAQGKMLFWRRDVLERAGGIAALGTEMAEDVASTKVVRAAGLKVRLVGQFFEQPIGQRDFAVVWGRQIRWAKVRRMGFRALYVPEVLAGAALPFVALLASGAFWALPGFLLAWYLPEALLAARAGWPRQVEDIGAWVLRDALNPALWVLGWRGTSFEWRGNAMDKSQVGGPVGPGSDKPGSDKPGSVKS